jgi:hypothetical protein
VRAAPQPSPHWRRSRLFPIDVSELRFTYALTHAAWDISVMVERAHMAADDAIEHEQGCDEGLIDWTRVDADPLARGAKGRPRRKL